MKYLKKKTSMAISTKILEFVPSPAVTIMPPWKVKFEGPNLPPYTCTDMHNTSQEVWNCILEKSYNISDVIIEESHNGSWRLELTDPYTGIFWTRADLFNMSTIQKESYDIEINENISTTSIALHDPNFFMINLNPVTVPKVIRQGEKSDPYLFQLYLEVTEVSKMNMPSNPCETSLSHSLTKCIKDYVITV